MGITSAEDGEVTLKNMNASKLIDKRIAGLGDWRGETLARMRKLIKEAAQDVVEEWTWMGIWSRDGVLCTGESHKAVVKSTFMKGASPKDPKKLFNSSWTAPPANAGKREKPNRAK